MTLIPNEVALRKGFSAVPADRRRYMLPSYAIRRFSRRFGISQTTAAEIARVAGFPQEARI
jgi:hypothetical protein